MFFFSSGRRHTRCALVTGVQTCALPILYFARAASLIEGLGVRYDPMFNPVLDAAPVAMRMRRRILASFRDGSAAGPTTADWAEAMGTVLEIGRASCRARVCPYV